MKTYTIYDHPADYPGHWVVREWLVEGGGEPVPGPVFMLADELETARDALEAMGLVCLSRDQGDDRTIVETWI